MRHMVLPVPPIDLEQHIHTQLPEVRTGPSALEFLGAIARRRMSQRVWRFLEDLCTALVVHLVGDRPSSPSAGASVEFFDIWS